MSQDSKETVPTPDVVLEAEGDSCATLTPRIKAHIHELESGKILEVRSDDPAAREGVPAWSRLTGNPLITTIEEDAQRTRFFLQRK